MLGMAPPPRVFAGAALIGAYKGAADAAGAPRLGTIYVALSPASSGKDPEAVAERIATQMFSATPSTSSPPDSSSHVAVGGCAGDGMLHTPSPNTAIPIIHRRASL